MCTLLDTGFDTTPVRKNNIETVLTDIKVIIKKESINN
jgi:hypothetical protein